MFRILKYIDEQMKKEERKKARREAVKRFFAGLLLSMFLSVVVGAIFTLVGYEWFVYITEPTSWHLTGAIVVSVFVFVLMVCLSMVAWYSGDDEDVD